MNLNFGANLKRLRRERDMTQDELAEAFGLSTQAISRYETNSGYPDIEMLPVIAGYFGVTVDSLLGVSVKESQTRRNEYYSRFRTADGAEAQLEILNKWRAEFPEEWPAVYNTMLAIGKLPEEKRDMNALRQIAKDALKRCTNPTWHDKLLFGYLESEDDEKAALDFIGEYGSETDVSKLTLMGDYYQGRDESKWHALYQYRMLDQADNVLNFLTSYRNVGDVRKAIEGCELSLDFLRKLSRNEDLTKPDMWANTKLMSLLRLSNNCLFFDEREKGFEALDQAVTLIENFIGLTDGTKITCGTPIFSALDCVTKKGVVYYGGSDCLHSYNGLAIFLNYENLPFDEKSPIHTWNFYPTNYANIIIDARWHNFKRYKNDPEYQKYVARVKKAADISERKNVEYILTHGVVKDPNGGRLCAVKAETRDNHALLFILLEEPQKGFAKAISQLKETVGRGGISGTEVVMTVNAEQKEVETPEEVKTAVANAL